MVKVGAVNEFVTHLDSQDYKLGTVENYRVCLTQFFKWFEQELSQTDPAHVTPLDIRQYRDKMKENYKPKTINKRLTILSVFFRWCAGQGYTATDPTQGIKRMTEAKRAPRWLSRVEVYAILRAAAAAVQVAKLKGNSFTERVAVRQQAIIVVMLNTGVRVSELCDLLLKDLSLSERSGQLTIRWGKGDKYREIPLNKDARQAVRVWLDTRKSESDYLFTTDKNGRMTRQLVSWHLDEIGKAAGVKFSPHVLRHTFGKNMVDAKVSLDRVSMVMGHTGVDTTAIYTLPSQTDLAREVEKISWLD